MAIVQDSGETARAVVGRPFPKGVSGNPGGRPKGLARYVRELVGQDGWRIADFMLGVLDDEAERTETRMQAASWLADRGFGKAPLAYGEHGGGPVQIVEPVQIVVRSMFEGEAAVEAEGPTLVVDSAFPDAA